MSIEQIAYRCKGGDREAQRELYESLSARMFTALVHLVHDRAKAEDMLHDGFIRLFNKIDLYRGEGSFEGWARKIFINLALTEMRAEKHWGAMCAQEELINLPTHEASVVEKISYEELMHTIDGLPERERMILLLYCVEGYSHEEIAKQLNIAENYSRIILHRAKNRLMLMLKHD